MANRYKSAIATGKVTPQSQPIPGSTQVPNSAGGFTWEVDNWSKLNRFLIMGTEGGSYYASERKMTEASALAVTQCLVADHKRTVDTIVAISQAGRAPKNDPAIFALAMASATNNHQDNAYALSKLNEVCRIGTHLFAFIDTVKEVRGWGANLRRAVANWYLAKEPEQLAFQVVKYRHRHDFTHRDVLRLSHGVSYLNEKSVKNVETYRTLMRWVVNRDANTPEKVLHKLEDGVKTGIKMLDAFDQLRATTDIKKAAKIVATHKMPEEAIKSVNTEWLNSPLIWDAMLPNLGLTNIIRNLARMTASGYLTQGSDAQRLIIDKLANSEALKKARVHPIAVLAALKTYESGHGVKGKLTWNPLPKLVDALDDAFYGTFTNVEPTGKRRLLALDVSGSMDGGQVAGIAGLTPRVVSAALAMVTMKVEPHTEVMGFSATFMPLKISKKQRLDDVIKAINNLPFAGTDCVLPMTWATANRSKFDAFEVYTDSETWAGVPHPSQALVTYRKTSGIEHAKLVVLGMVANNFTIADPNDPGMLDVVGFDTAVPGLINEFIQA